MELQTDKKGFHDLHGIVKNAQELLTEMADQRAPKHIAVLALNGNRHFGHFKCQLREGGCKKKSDFSHFQAPSHFGGGRRAYLRPSQDSESVY